jgi:hypothetical protein
MLTRGVRPLGPALSAVTWPKVPYAVLSLTAVRTARVAPAHRHFSPLLRRLVRAAEPGSNAFPLLLLEDPARADGRPGAREYARRPRRRERAGIG